MAECKTKSNEGVLETGIAYTVRPTFSGCATSCCACSKAIEKDKYMAVLYPQDSLKNDKVVHFCITCTALAKTVLGSKFIDISRVHGNDASVLTHDNVIQLLDTNIHSLQVAYNESGLTLCQSHLEDTVLGLVPDCSTSVEAVHRYASNIWRVAYDNT